MKKIIFPIQWKCLILKLFLSLSMMFFHLEVCLSIPFDKPQVPILTLTGAADSYNTDWYPDGKIWQTVSKAIGDTNYFLVPIFVDNKWYHYKSTSKSEVYIPDTIKSFEFSLLYDSTAVEPVGIQTSHPIRDSNMLMMPKFHDIQSYYEPLAKDFNINWSLVPDNSYGTIFSEMVPQNLRDKGWAIKISGNTNSGLTICDTSVVDFKILLYVKFKVKLVQGLITDNQRSSKTSTIYIDYDTIKYNNWNIRVDAPFKNLRETYSYVIEDYPDPDSKTGLTGIDNSSLPQWNLSPSLYGVIYLNLYENLPKMWSFSENIAIENYPVCELKDTILNSISTFNISNSVLESRLLDIDIWSDQPWMKFNILHANLRTYVPYEFTRKGIINYLDKEILGNLTDIRGSSTEADSIYGIEIICDSSKLTTFNFNNIYIGNLFFFSKTAFEDTISVKVIYKNIYELPSSYKVIGGGSYCKGGEGVFVGLDSSETNVIYELLLNNYSTDTLKMGTGNPISFGFATSSGTYTILARNVVTNSVQLMDSSVVITIDSLPSKPIITGKDSVCEHTIEMYSIEDVNGTNISWSVLGGTMLFTSDSTYQNISWGSATTGTITVFRTDIITECYDSTMFLVTIRPRPLLPVISDTTIYQGENLVLTPDTMMNTIFYWYYDEFGGSIDTIASSLELKNLTRDTTIYVESFDTLTQCSSSSRKRIRITVSDSNILDFNLKSYNVDVCKEDSILIGLDGPINNGTPPFIYRWYPTEGVSNPNDSVTFVKPPRTMDYTLNVTDIKNKKGNSKVNITLNSKPETPEITRNIDSLFASPGSIFRWFLDGIVIAGETGYKLKLYKSGYYSVLAISNRGCYSDTTEPEYFEYKPISVKDGQINKHDFDRFQILSLMPNPLKDFGYFKVKMENTGNLFIKIININGETVKIINSSLLGMGEHEFKFNVENLTNGVYFLYTECLGQNKQMKFIVEK